MIVKREVLIAKREEKGFSHEELAIKSGISRSYYTRIESGTRSPSLIVMMRIALALDENITLFLSEIVPFSNRGVS